MENILKNSQGFCFHDLKEILCIIKMKNFELIENQMTGLGLYRPHSIVGSNRFKYKYASILFMFGIYVVLMGIPMYSLRTVSQFATGCFGFGAAVSLMCTCTLLMWQTPNIYALMDHFKEVIEKREFRKKNTNLCT